ncbi:MAG TPA: Hsp20/alpha crystallin family protein [Thermoanaerobaculia bacterium]|nr:Hsp20/alpha crystallin family protein [Thermoanaerobaculia bacterium]HXT52649.1 Hsp20/alpha crystallin family protein [Thermoanaerobaculia bacterium]
MPAKPSRRYSGVVVVSQLRSELDRLIQEVLAATETVSRGGWTPATDVVDLGHAILVQVEVAGVGPGDLRVEIDGTTLRVTGRRRLSFPEPGRIRFHCLERQEGSFERQVEIFEPVNFAKATARLERGLLCIELPRVEDRRRRHVELVVEEADEPAEAASSKSTPEPKP